MRKTLVAATTALSVGLFAAFALADVTGPFEVKSASVNEQNPAASADYFAWTEAPPDHPNRTQVWAEPTPIDGTDAFLVNDSGRAWTGGIVDDTLVYQHVVSRDSNIRLHDLATDNPLLDPAAINTANWEWHPTISTDSADDTWILFGRQNISTGVQRVLAYNLTDASGPITLDSTNRRSYSLLPGQVNGDWVTWTACKPKCNVWSDNLLDGSPAAKVPRVEGATHQYGGSVKADGTVYFAVSGRGCGANVAILRYSSPAEPVHIQSLPARRDVFFPYVSEQGADTHVYYDQVNCRTGTWNIFEVVDSP